MNTVGKSWFKKWWGVALIILITLILSILFAFVLYVINFMSLIKGGSLPAEIIASPSYSKEQQKIIEGNNSYWIGAADPKVTVVEFGDFACPLCKNSFTKIREIGLKYKDYVKHIYRDYPAQGEISVTLALAARCAGEQGLFWLMHDKLFQNQGVVAGENELMALANQVGADTANFEHCLNTGKYLKDVQVDFNEGQKLEINGTPTWFINGYKIEGDIPYDIFIQIIEYFIQE